MSVKLMDVRCHLFTMLLSATAAMVFLLQAQSAIGTVPGCKFPPTWNGTWFVMEAEEQQQPMLPQQQQQQQVGSSYNLTVGLEDFGPTAFCHSEEERGVKYVLFDRSEKCYTCVLFSTPHPNLMLMRQGSCQPDEGKDVDGAALCAELTSMTPTTAQPPGSLSSSPVSATAVRMTTKEEEMQECPFQMGERGKRVGPEGSWEGEKKEYTFTLKQAGATCNRPDSRLVSCMTPSMVAFRFSPACAGVGNVAASPSGDASQDTEIAKYLIGRQDDGVETLTCLATWKEDEKNYLLARIEKTDDEFNLRRLQDQIRCFLYMEKPGGGYRLSQSASPSCSGLTRPTDGVRQMNINKVPSSSRQPQSQPQNSPAQSSSCRFPPWAVRAGALHTFKYTSLYNFTNARQLVIHRFNYLTMEVGRMLSKTRCLKIVENVVADKVSRVATTLVSDGAVEDDGEEEEQEEQEVKVKMVTEVTAGCVTQYKCMMLYKRSDDVIELQEGRPVDNMDQACRQFSQRRLKFTTLIRSDLEIGECVVNGVHNVTFLNLSGLTEPCRDATGFQQVLINCDESESGLMVFGRDCTQQNNRTASNAKLFSESNNHHHRNGGKSKDVSKFYCQGGWESQLPESFYGRRNRGGNNNPFGGNNNYYDSGGGGGYSPAGGYGGSGGSGGYPTSQYGVLRELGRGDVSRPDEELEYLLSGEENVTLGFLLARPANPDQPKAPRRICLTYIRDANGTTYSWVVDTSECKRNVFSRPPGSVLGPAISAIKFRFSSVKLEPCGAPSHLLLCSSLWIALIRLSSFSLALSWLANSYWCFP